MTTTPQLEAKIAREVKRVKSKPTGFRVDIKIEDRKSVV